MPEECLKELTVSDLETLEVDEKMNMDPVRPRYIFYYCTMSADALGVLTLYEKQLVFEPLNHLMRGFYSYEGTRGLNEPATSTTTPSSASASITETSARKRSSSRL